MVLVNPANNNTSIIVQVFDYNYYQPDNYLEDGRDAKKITVHLISTVKREQTSRPA